MKQKNIEALKQFKESEIYGPTFDHYLNKEERRAFEHYIGMINLRGTNQDKVNDINTLLMLAIKIKEINTKEEK